jgi:hypothetical protein
MAGYQCRPPLLCEDESVTQWGYFARNDHPRPGPVPMDAGTQASVKSKPDSVDVLRLKQIQSLVANNNVSTIDNDVIVCQIYMESRFDGQAGRKRDAKGLMQMQLNAVQQVFKFRKQKELGHMPSDAQTKVAFAAGATYHQSEDMFDEAKNIAIGTEYMQYWVDSTDTIDEAYKRYRGRENGVYYRKISTCAKRLKAEPNSMQPLLDMVAPPK